MAMITVFADCDSCGDVADFRENRPRHWLDGWQVFISGRAPSPAAFEVRGAAGSFCEAPGEGILAKAHTLENLGKPPMQ